MSFNHLFPYLSFSYIELRYTIKMFVVCCYSPLNYKKCDLYFCTKSFNKLQYCYCDIISWEEYLPVGGQVGVVGRGGQGHGTRAPTVHMAKGIGEQLPQVHWHVSIVPKAVVVSRLAGALDTCAMFIMKKTFIHECVFDIKLDVDPQRDDDASPMST